MLVSQNFGDDIQTLLHKFKHIKHFVDITEHTATPFDDTREAIEEPGDEIFGTAGPLQILAYIVNWFQVKSGMSSKSRLLLCCAHPLKESWKV